VRQFLVVGVPVLLPLALYLVWFARASRAAQAAGLAAPKLGDVPWPWLVAIGVLLIISAGTAFVMFGGNEGPDGQYEPAHIIDGRVVPGRITR
jgi:hypothetical protein